MGKILLTVLGGLVLLTALAAAAAGSALSIVLGGGPGGSGGPGGARPAGLAKGTVPAAYQDLVRTWGQLCPQISPALLAAQLYQESGFRPDAQSPAQAQGIAQFIPGTWATHGIDGDRDGDKDVWDPKDAIPSAASYDCELAGYVKDVPGDPTQNMLAAYNAGAGRVTQYGGVPPYTETRNYVKVIRDLEQKFAAHKGRRLDRDG